MLEELRINNFAIIESLDLTFSAGFNVITGETGAGKSIIIDAMELIMGGKADSANVRAGADKASIEGTFKLDERTRAIIVPLLEENELQGDDDDYVILGRDVRANGRSVGRVNGVTVTLDILREIGDTLVDIHGQSTHLSLLKPRSHLDLLDRYADLLEVRAALGTVVSSLHNVRAEIKTLQDDKDALQRKADRLRYEVDEIDAAQLEDGEETNLKAERNRLANSEQLATLASQANVLLGGDDGDGADDAVSAVEQLQEIAQLMGKLAKIDPDLQEDYTLAEEMAAQAQELALTVAGYVDEVDYDPDRLNELEERLELIKTLKRRYKVETIAEILAYADKSRDELASIEHSDERLEALREQEDKILHHIGELCQRMNRVREIAGKNLGKRIVRELRDLRMDNAQFEVVIETEEDPDNGCYIDGKRYAFTATGMDKLEFMMSANVGEPLRPLAKVASGGEAARIMLALKRVLAQADETPTLIFDEIDQGIGGRIGAVVGEKLWSLTSGHQVMVVTHLPQLAGYGDVHYHVSKGMVGKRTRTQVAPLNDEDGRVRELAAMLGAEGEAGLQSARDLLTSARERKTAMTHEANAQAKRKQKA
jgi:DNA repair protein RecN (Recombination protein N)